MNKILVVDDQKTVCYSIQRLLQSEGYDVLTASNGTDALSIINHKKPDLVIMDVRMPEMDGLEVLGKIKESHPDVQVIMMTAFSTTEKAIQAMKLGAYDYLTKPFDNNGLLIRVNGAIKARDLMKEVVTLDEIEDYEGERIVGKSPAMLNIYKQIGKVAPTDATVLIRGESGAGKELAARAIYHYSKRSAKPFLAINCAAIPEHLLESELFGYERGAFTGADFKKIGKFEQCSGGTVFLDEIGDMSLGLQAKILRILQDGAFERLGGSETIKTDVRIVAATNKHLEDMVKEGLFREDLYYRLNVVSISLPPLRERKEDIKELAAYFIKKFNRKLGKNIKGITQEALEGLKEHSWTGNVRELENTIQKAMVFCNSDYLSIECCENLNLQKIGSCASVEDAIENLVNLAFKDGCHERFQDMMSMIEKGMVKRAMELTKGNQVHAAKLLGISRNTLRKKLGEE
ncbi:MAG: sigma-54 dependent transcriptional regulator [Nitrospirae bacterium]|nr:sigma-54 dependent transcriptional regulator [Nitrospirota bacterium]MCL5976635.1 sigma-54 dependent transcriptional regulator [Nitrospirota bacterium]